MTKYRVFIMEYERGWGSRVDEQLDFNSYKEARTYQKKFNDENRSKIVPDWYMVATEPEEIK